MRFSLFIGLAFSLLLSGLVRAVEVHDVRLVGLFKDTAVLHIKDKQRLVKLGQVSPEGVRVLSVTGSQATLLIEGKKHQLGLTRAVSRYAKTEKSSHTIAINSYGQYFTSGSVNGQPVRFLVDTGATSVAMNSQQARSLGIDFAQGPVGQVSTAGGIVKAYSVSLSSIKVGGVEAKNVRGSVLEGVYPTHILLGMTYLRHVKMAENNGMMTLTEKY